MHVSSSSEWQISLLIREAKWWTMSDPLIGDGPMRTRLRLVNGTMRGALHCTFPHCVNFGVDFLPRCCQASMLLQWWNLFYPCFKSQERGIVCWLGEEAVTILPGSYSTPVLKSNTEPEHWLQQRSLMPGRQERASFQSCCFSPLLLKKEAEVWLCFPSALLVVKRASSSHCPGTLFGRETEAWVSWVFLHFIGNLTEQRTSLGSPKPC